MIKSITVSLIIFINEIFTTFYSIILNHLEELLQYCTCVFESVYKLAWQSENSLVLISLNNFYIFFVRVYKKSKKNDCASNQLVFVILGLCYMCAPYVCEASSGHVYEDIHPALLMNDVIECWACGSRPWGAHRPPRTPPIPPLPDFWASPSSLSNTALYEIYCDGLIFIEAHSFRSLSESKW